MLVGVVIVVFWEKELPYVSGSSFFYLIFGRSLFGILLFFYFSVLWSYIFGHTVFIYSVIRFRPNGPVSIKLRAEKMF